MPLLVPLRLTQPAFAIFAAHRWGLAVGTLFFGVSPHECKLVPIGF
jgi:hypothetical protein